MPGNGEAGPEGPASRVLSGSLTLPVASYAAAAASVGTEAIVFSTCEAIW
jgi:hypothetical protein